MSCDCNLTIMRILIPMLLLPVLAFAAGQSGTNASSTINVMPLPAFVPAQPGNVKLDGAFTVSRDGYPDGRLQAAILRLQQRLEGRTGMDRKSTRLNSSHLGISYAVF